MSTFIERMVGAASLKSRVFEEIEADGAANSQALAVVLLASAAAGIGVGSLAVTAAAVTGWVAWAVLIYVIGAQLFPEAQTRTNVGELLRTTGFAQAPGVLLVLIAVPRAGPWLWMAVSVWMLAAMVVGVRQALDYTSIRRAVAVCVNGWILAVVIVVVVGIFFGPTLS